jgi:hypothetical protein
MGEITMNKKIVLAQVAAIYIAMIGVGSAAQPELGPVPVEVINTPLQVTVTNAPTPAAPEVRIPFTERHICSMSTGESSCIAESFRTVRFPRDTNTLVFQSLSVSQSSDVQPQQFGVRFTTKFREGTFRHSLPFIAGTDELDGTGSVRNEMRQLTLYHDGVDEDVAELIPVKFYFILAEPVDSHGAMSAVLTGYFTWVEPR